MTDDAVQRTTSVPSGLDEPALTWQEVVKWWEVRRIYYNLILLGVGLVSMAFMVLIAWPIGLGLLIGPHGVTILAVLVYGFGANVMYTIGEVVELHARTIDPFFARRQALWTHKVGLRLSMALTTAPILLGIVVRIFMTIGSIYS
jgi:hypothetical protein